MRHGAVSEPWGVAVLHEHGLGYAIELEHACTPANLTLLLADLIDFENTNPNVWLFQIFNTDKVG